MINDAERMNGMLGDLGFSEEEIKYKIVEGGEHHMFLGDEFRETYLWLFPEAASSVKPVLSNTFFSVYPNPFNNETNITYIVSENGHLEIEFFNLSGKCIKSVYFKNQVPGRYEYRWDTEELPAGIYYVRVRQGDMILTRKLIKQ